MSNLLGFNVPDELTDHQVALLFGMWAEFADLSRDAMHTPSADCEECVTVFNGYVRVVMGEEVERATRQL